MGDQAPPQLSLASSTGRPTSRPSWRYLVDRAQAAEEAGIDRVVVSDHVVFGEDLDAYGEPEVGAPPAAASPPVPTGSWLEPLTSLAVIAGATTAVRLGTNILLAALRRPVVLAKTAATLDVLSGGRLDLGVGVGWQREEYEAAGLDFDRRGRLLDHTLEVCQTLWTRAAGRAPLRRAELRRDPHDAEAGRGGRRADLGERHAQPPASSPGWPASAPGGSRGATRPPTCGVDPRDARAVAARGRDPGDSAWSGRS